MLPIPFNNPATYPGHSGVDFPQPEGTQIKASGDGTVTYSGWQNNNAGYATVVRYDGGPLVLYCHQPESGARRPGPGQRVSLRSHLGVVGSTGRSIGPHLHMEILDGHGANTYAGVWNYFTGDYTVDGGSPAIVNPPVNAITESKENKVFVARVTHGNIQGNFLIIPNGAGLPSAVGLGGGAGTNLPYVDITDFSDAFWKTVSLR